MFICFCCCKRNWIILRAPLRDGGPRHRPSGEADQALSSGEMCPVLDMGDWPLPACDGPSPPGLASLHTPEPLLECQLTGLAPEGPAKPVPGALSWQASPSSCVQSSKWAVPSCRPTGAALSVSFLSPGFYSRPSAGSISEPQGPACRVLSTDGAPKAPLWSLTLWPPLPSSCPGSECSLSPWSLPLTFPRQSSFHFTPRCMAILWAGLWCWILPSTSSQWPPTEARTLSLLTRPQLPVSLAHAPNISSGGSWRMRK